MVLSTIPPGKTEAAQTATAVAADLLLELLVVSLDCVYNQKLSQVFGRAEALCSSFSFLLLGRLHSYHRVRSISVVVLQAFLYPFIWTHSKSLVNLERPQGVLFSCMIQPIEFTFVASSAALGSLPH